MTHLRDDELVRWRDAPDPEDRERIIAHLAACDACGARYAEMIRTAPATSTESRFDAEAFRSRGYRALAPAPRWRGLLLGSRWAPLGAAAALVAVVAGAYLASRPDRGSEPVMRGAAAGVTLVRPAGDVRAGSELRFEWEIPEGAAASALRVYNLASPGEAIISREGVASGYVLTADERRRLQPGIPYRWFVEYGSADGTLVSPAATFVLRE